MLELVGRGVYTAIPDHLPNVGCGQQAVVVGRPERAAPVALRLSDCGCQVTMVTRETARGAQMPRALRHHRNLRVRFRTELSWAVGIDHLEAVVLRHLTSGRIDVLNADALVVLSDGPER